MPIAPLLFWSRLIQAAAAVVLTLSAVLMLAPDLGERVFNLVYFQQLASPVPAPAPVAGYIQFANGIIGAVMAGWYAVDTAFSMAHGVWGNVLLNTGKAPMFGIPLMASRRYFGTMR